MKSSPDTNLQYFVAEEIRLKARLKFSITPRNSVLLCTLIRLSFDSKLRAISSVLSVLQLLTMMYSKSLNVCARTLSMHCSRYWPQLYTGVRTLTKGVISLPLMTVVLCREVVSARSCAIRSDKARQRRTSQC